ncbi:hypothetical protein [uncultured Enterococcus sp.]|uniref:hypothetical protein n=1 Tax=uncultured Enterococcus sp. TaxID=167972 RepID=UPI0025FD6231|nr:hypothetical protein [uncultured Enterococcus sp.]
MKQSIYIHIDTTSNIVMTRGLQAADFHTGIVHPPKNLLLLNPASTYGDYEAHTGLKIVRGVDAVEQYAQIVAKQRLGEENKWIDFSDLSMLRELSPLEISELLYFGHTRTHLRSPFFYKLQNNFVYFDLPQRISRIYYRYLDEFYRVLAGKIKRQTLENLNDKRSFFKRPLSIADLPLEVIKQIHDYTKEGIVLSFDQATKDTHEFHLPLYLTDQEFASSKEVPLERYVGELSYHINSKNWSLTLADSRVAFI